MTQSNTSFISSSNQTTEPEAFPARLLAISTLQIIANSTQFTSIKSISLQTLTQVASRYLQLLAEAARAHADHSGRNQINAWDLSGLLENLNGNGAISSLHNWCIDQHSNSNSNHQSSHPIEHLNYLSDINSIPDEPFKLATISKRLNINHCISTNLNPITSLSFLPLTDSEVAELDKAGETDLEESLNTPSPAGSSSSGSSEDDSDLELPPIKPIEVPTIAIEPQPATTTTVTESLIERWRSIEDIPSFVPSHFPPLPGLEKVIKKVTIEGEEINPIHEPIVVQIEEPELEIETNLTQKQDPYLTSIPYTKSQLFEQYGTQSFPRLPFSSSFDSLRSSPPKKKVKIDSTLECFQETYSFCLEENRNENSTLKPNPNRIKYLNAIKTQEINDSLFTNIPIKSIRSNRWSAGWIPHPPPNRTTEFPELRPFGHTALPTPLTMPVPIEFPSPNLLIHPAQSRIPSLIPTIFKSLDSELIKNEAEVGVEDHRHETFTILNRLTRLGPPCELGQSGEPTTYRIKADDPTTTTTNNSNEGPKYMEWGFHWPSNHGHEPFKSKQSKDGNQPQQEEDEEEKFVNAPFPVMPKTSAERARLLEIQCLEREREMNRMKVDQVAVQGIDNPHPGNVGGG